MAIGPNVIDDCEGMTEEDYWHGMDEAMQDEEGDEPFCTCSTGHGIEETDGNQCDSCGEPIYDEEPAVPPAPTFPILTGRVGTNADQFPDVLEMYVPEGATVADVTYGKGVFWRNIPDGKYNLLATDLQTGTDFSRLPYENQSIDALVLDPPYMHGGVTVKASINECYKNQNTSHASVVRLYAAGILEAARVLRKKGRIIVKTQDEIESGKQRLTHVELINILESFGFCILDIFVLLQPSIPAMREQYQKSARKNHSFAIVGEFRS